MGIKLPNYYFKWKMFSGCGSKNKYKLMLKTKKKVED